MASTRVSWRPSPRPGARTGARVVEALLRRVPHSAKAAAPLVAGAFACFRGSAGAVGAPTFAGECLRQCRAGAARARTFLVDCSMRRSCATLRLAGGKRVIVGVPKEVKEHEYRVAMLPVGVEELTRAGTAVLVERGAGLGSGIRDEDYAAHGARSRRGAARDLRPGRADREGQGAAARGMAAAARGQICSPTFISPPTRSSRAACRRPAPPPSPTRPCRRPRVSCRCLTPMSEVAGRMSIQQGAKYLERPQEGRGILLGGVPGVEPAHISVLGGGVVGTNAAKIAAGLRRERRSCSTSTSTGCATSTTSCRPT